MIDAPPDNSYAALGQRLREIVGKVTAAQDVAKPILGISDLMFLSHLTDIELPAIDDLVEAATLNALTSAREAVEARRQCTDLQASNSKLHERIVRLQGRLDAAVRGEATLVEALTNAE